MTVPVDIVTAMGTTSTIVRIRREIQRVAKQCCGTAIAVPYGDRAVISVSFISKKRLFFKIISFGCTKIGNRGCCPAVGVKGGSDLEEKRSTLKRRIKEGRLRREDVLRRLAELAFGQPNDCVRLALEDIQDLKDLDLSLLSEIKRSDKGMVEIRLIDRVKVLERLEQAMDGDGDGMGELLRALGSGEEP